MPIKKLPYTYIHDEDIKQMPAYCLSMLGTMMVVEKVHGEVDINRLRDVYKHIPQDMFDSYLNLIRESKTWKGEV